LLLRLPDVDTGHLIGMLRLLAEIRNRQWRLSLRDRALMILLLVEFGYM
jgi:hypothetical protein